MLRRARLQAESLTIARELGDKRGIVYSLAAFASLALEENAMVHAVRLMAAGSALRESFHFPSSSDEREEVEQEESAAKTVLGEAAFAAAWAEGRAMTMEQATAYALGETEA